MNCSSHAETNVPVRALGDGLFQVGLVQLDKNSRVASFPAVMNMREEITEYIVVHKTGKTHESIFRTDARPQDVHVAMLLLGVKPVMTNMFGADGKGFPSGDKVFVKVSWINNGTRIEYATEDLVLNRQTKEPMARGEWIYNESNFSEGAFTAQRDGSIISTHIDPDALINNPRPGRENDDLFAPNTGKLPAIGTPVEITIRLAREK
ncbi:MAG TPA: YdjY domain-containing protein [Candidatus Limnocylindria bacterium]|nr:YdjY domain-containing protein [Candidatus Limnocylindria bacterium]